MVVSMVVTFVRSTISETTIVTEHIPCYVAGYMNCARYPPGVKLHAARERLAEHVEFPVDIKVAFDDIIGLVNMPYPPQTIAEADDMYLYLRPEAHRVFD